MAKVDELKKSVKTSVKNVVEEVVSGIVYKIVKTSTKRAVKELKEKLKEKSLHRLEARLKDITEKKLEKQLEKSVKQVAKEISKAGGEKADFIQGIERVFEQGFEKYLLSLSKWLIPLKLVGIGVVVAVFVVGGIYAYDFFGSLRQWVDITIYNNCSEVLVYTASGVEPPSREIAPFGTSTIKVPAVKVTVRRDSQGFFVSALGREFRFRVATEAKVRLNDISIPPGFEGVIDLQQREEHELEIRCD